MFPDPAQTGLQRFVDAQDKVYQSVRDELALGAKTSHWMWFVFPQLKELGRSQVAKYYGIESKEEAITYWRHPILGKRLIECTKLVLAQGKGSARDIFGFPDDLKFHSCMTLFAQAAPQEPAFTEALRRFFDGRPDQGTLNLLGGRGS